MVHDNRARRVAIACQGGGSHTAFTAGCLEELLRQSKGHVSAVSGAPWEVVGLSGTSGGAICALLGASRAEPAGAEAAGPLTAFWRANSATSLLDMGLNWAGVAAARANLFPETSPYDAQLFRGALDWWDLALALSPIPPPAGWFPMAGPRPLRLLWDGRERLKALLDQHVPFAELRRRWSERRAAGDPIPKLLVGAADVLEGRFKVFRCDDRVCDVDADAILASAAIPTLFEATRIHDRSGEHVYWDALFSQNPPVRDFVSVQRDLGEEPPDEIWVIQINPQRSGREPKQIGEILDRRNELTGNLSLNQELGFIKSMNKWLLDKDKVSPEWFTPVWIHRIELIMERDGHDALDLASKLDRSAAHVDQLMDAGKRAAAGFLEQWRARSAPFEVLPLTVRRLTGEQLRALKEDWTCLRSKAGDQPAREVVTEAGKLVQRAMRERGYPVADFFDRLSDICATDQEVATQYPPTMEMVLRARDGLASGDELHEGWQRCEALLRHLLDPAQPPRPVFPEAPRTVRAARTSAGASALQRLAQRVAGVVL